MKVLCLFVRYGKTDSLESLNTLLGWQKKNLSGLDVETWIVDNALPRREKTKTEGVFRVFPGDNSVREFSAWDSVLKTNSNVLEKFSVLHFVTEKFNTLYTRYLEHFDQEVLASVTQGKICLGHVDCYDREISLFKHRSQHWIRTCFFFMSPASWRKLGGIVSLRDPGMVFSPSGEYRPASLSSQYKIYINDWLKGVPIQGVSWHSRISDPDLFQKKVMAILNEHMLSIRLRQQGIRLMDYCWSWRQTAHKKIKSISLPGWEKQVEFRRDFLKTSN